MSKSTKAAPEIDKPTTADPAQQKEGTTNDKGQVHADAYSVVASVMAQTHPLIAARVDAWRKANGDVNIAEVRITTKFEGFRRAGIRHVGAKTYSAVSFTADQLEKLLASPELVVEFLGAGLAADQDAG